ncbi:hypothetical protein [Nonomuraea polychroma]|uniref:hypothetical protein n=1 Tax=Nonomuraea polychroma TaxID=46176 RepID=UPI000FDCF2CA|nr:hypothetical protein [Nonomuraea polychroma]
MSSMIAVWVLARVTMRALCRGAVCSGVGQHDLFVSSGGLAEVGVGRDGCGQVAAVDQGEVGADAEGRHEVGGVAERRWGAGR